MNCRPGDLAIVVNCRIEENLGAVVHVLRPHGGRPGVWVVKAMQRMLGYRELEPLHPVGAGGLGNIPDRNLRPLRDEEGDDETLRWARTPDRVAA